MYGQLNTPLITHIHHLEYREHAPFSRTVSYVAYPAALGLNIFLTERHRTTRFLLA